MFWLLYLVSLLQCYLYNWTFDFPPSHHLQCSTNIITGKCISYNNVKFFKTHTSMHLLSINCSSTHSSGINWIENKASYLPCQLKSDRFIFCALYIPVLRECSFRPWHELNINLNQKTKTFSSISQKLDFPAIWKNCQFWLLLKFYNIFKLNASCDDISFDLWYATTWVLFPGGKLPDLMVKSKTLYMTRNTSLVLSAPCSKLVTVHTCSTQITDWPQ